MRVKLQEWPNTAASGYFVKKEPREPQERISREGGLGLGGGGGLGWGGVRLGGVRLGRELGLGGGHVAPVYFEITESLKYHFLHFGSSF